MIFLKKTSTKTLLLLGSLIIFGQISCFKNLTTMTVVYQNNFDTYNIDGLSFFDYRGNVTDIMITKYNNNPVLGRFNNGGFNLTVSNLPAHTAINVTFDLYIHEVWKNDLWKYSFNGANQILTGFSNDSTIQQSYPNWLGNGSPLYPARTGAFNRNLTGACLFSSAPNGTSLYKMERTFMDNETSFSLSCSDAGAFASIPCNRSWSIDNLVITLIKN